MSHLFYGTLFQSLLIELFVLQDYHAAETNLRLVSYDIVSGLVVIARPLSRDKRRHGVGEVKLNLKARLVAQLAEHLFENGHPLLQTKRKISSYKNVPVSNNG